MLGKTAQQTIIDRTQGISRPGLIWPLIVILIRFPLINTNVISSQSLTFNRLDQLIDSSEPFWVTA